MSVKKSFSIGKELASGIRNTVQAVSSNPGQLHYDLMSMDIIERDPLNPRKLSITQSELIKGIDKTDPDYATKQKEFDALYELAESIKKVGVRNAIEVYKNGNHYRIISGERRFLASFLAGQTHIPSRISQKPDEFKLRYMQWVENINREDLSLYEKYNNLVTIANAYKENQNKEIEPALLQEMLGTSTPQAYRYFSLLNAEPELIELVKDNKITNLKVIVELANMRNKQLRVELIQRIKDSKEEGTLSNFNTITHKKQSAKRQAALNKAINLGSLRDKNLARELFQIILQDARLAKHSPNFSDTDWKSEKGATKAFKSLIGLIEKELA